MKPTVPLSLLLFLGFCWMILCSAVVPPMPIDPAPPAKNQTVTQQKRHQKRLLRLERRLARTKSSKAKARIQHKIQQHQTTQGLDVGILSILALVFAFLIPIVGLILAIIARNQGGGLIATIAFWVSIVFLILFVIGILLL